MKKILIGLSILGVGAVVVLGARKGLQEHAAAEVVVVVPDTTARRQATTLERTDRGPMYPEGGPQLLPRTAESGSAASNQEGVRSQGGTSRQEAAPRQESAPATEPGRVSGSPPRATSAEDQPEPVQESEIATVLRRAAKVYAGAQSLQADFSQRSRNPILRTTVSSEGTLYQRRPDRFLMRFSDPAGDLIVSDGNHFWVYYPSVDRKQVLRMPASQGAGGVDLQAQFVGDPLERFRVTSEGREEVAGRNSYVLLLEPREAIGYRTLKVWIDAADYLVRQFEVTEENGIVRHFELSNVKLNQKLADDLFHFTIPEGAHVVDRG